jgi:hypothetical protein
MSTKPENMKRIFLSLSIIAAVAFMPASRHGSSSAAAEVQQIQGCYIFVDAKPVSPTQYIGTVELTKKDVRKNPGTGQYQYTRDLLIKKVKDQYPEAEGIIFDFHDGGTDKADAIKFK